MSVAQGHEADAALDPVLGPLASPPGPGADGWSALDAHTAEVVVLDGRPVAVAERSARLRTALPPRPPVLSSPAAWAAALRLRTAPTALFGAAVGGLAVRRDPAVRPGLLALSVLLLLAATALTGLLRDLGDARPDRAGPLRRVEAGRAVLVLGALCAVLLGALVVGRDLRGLLLAAGAAPALLLCLSRRSGPVRSAAGGLLAGGLAALLAGWAATGALGVSALLVAALAGAPVAGLLAARRTALGPGAARALVLLPYAAAAAAVAAGAAPLGVLAVALALPAARRAARTGTAAVVAGHARLVGVVLLLSLLGAALAG